MEQLSQQPALAGGLSEITVGSMNYHVLRAIIEDGALLQLNRGAEIGVLYGDTSFYLLSKFPGLTLFCVDPYVEYNETGIDRTQQTLQGYEQTAHRRCRIFGSRAQFLKMFSVDAAQTVPDGSLDFVFIDAQHTYDSVKADLAAWSDKVRSGGLVAGHDYRWKGVGRAVDEYVSSRGVKGYCTPPSSDIWFFLKSAARV